jgi:hypothetical protein
MLPPIDSSCCDDRLKPPYLKLVSDLDPDLANIAGRLIASLAFALDRGIHQATHGTFMVAAE